MSMEATYAVGAGLASSATVAATLTQCFPLVFSTFSYDKRSSK